MNKYKEIKSLPDDYMEDSLLCNYNYEGYHDYLEISNCMIKSCDFSKAIFQGLDIDNSEVVDCNLSNLDLSEHSYKSS